MVRVKPDGVPDAPFEHMNQPHGTTYVKKDPAGGNGWDNEAFKVHNGEAIPSPPGNLELPAGVKEGSPEAEAYIRDNWKGPTHVPLKTDPL